MSNQTADMADMASLSATTIGRCYGGNMAPRVVFGVEKKDYHELSTTERTCSTASRVVERLQKRPALERPCHANRKSCTAHGASICASAAALPITTG